jgi:hypothetical protein
MAATTALGPNPGERVALRQLEEDKWQGRSARAVGVLLWPRFLRGMEEGKRWETWRRFVAGAAWWRRKRKGGVQLGVDARGGGGRGRSRRHQPAAARTRAGGERRRCASHEAGEKGEERMRLTGGPLYSAGRCSRFLFEFRI